MWFFKLWNDLVLSYKSSYLNTEPKWKQYINVAVFFQHATMSKQVCLVQVLVIFCVDYL